MNWKLKNGKIKGSQYIGERTVRTRVREKLGPLTEASLPLAQGRCIVCNETFKPGDYWTIVNRVELPEWDDGKIKVASLLDECAHWQCWRKPYRSLDAD